MLCLLMVASGQLVAIEQAQARQAGPDIEELVASMTLAEKVGQMTQLTMQPLSSVRGWPGTPFELDEAKLREALVERHVGSLLNVYDMALTTEQWVKLMEQVQTMAINETRLGIPIIYGIDAVHGNNYHLEATIFPHSIGMAASWNEDLVAEAGRITAQETRAVGLNWNFAPVLDVARQPLWSRFFESYGEDVLLATRLGSANVLAQQEVGDGGYPLVAATAKHFVGYSMPLSGKDRTPAWIPERMLREYFLPPFEKVVDDGILTLMVNSAEVNGEPVHASHWLLTEILKEELGFEGIIVTDWEDIKKLVDSHRVAGTFKEAVRQVVDAGVDMAMVPYDYTFTDALIELVEEGMIAESRIDESVTRILTVKKEIGLFVDAMPHPDDLPGPSAGATSLEAARESMTLLKNRDGILPLQGNEKIILAGPAADAITYLFGSWSYTWQGMEEGAYPEGTKTFKDEVTDRMEQVTFVNWDAHQEPDRIRAQAYGSDVVILALGEVPSVEKPGDIESLDMPADQVALVRTIAETGARVVVVLFQNRPRIIRQIEPYADAILLGYEPGPFGPEAAVDVLTGVVNPSGHLPFTYPRFTGSLVPYDYKWSEKADILFGQNAIHPQYEFGHGLSYTRFDYSNLTVEVGNAGPVVVTVSVTNTGHTSGKDVVQLYVRDEVASITPSNKRLRGFEKVELAPGETTDVTFELSRSELGFIGKDNTLVFEPGTFVFMVDDLSQTADVK
ncbi:MAG: glycoside hydrolase family 3 C-terminal domain-containing protein [Bacteroidetes bacterium]|nr:glycoside hydrolase family 3 C-terminal domain-containing protein [Bacteroidota bacterium]MDA1333501.1 glycoside hydrolase family 3 C-terminal domain-containing protein [Bacteroidota bacterium]